MPQSRLETSTNFRQNLDARLETILCLEKREGKCPCIVRAFETRTKKQPGARNLAFCLWSHTRCRKGQMREYRENATFLPRKQKCLVSTYPQGQWRLAGKLVWRASRPEKERGEYHSQSSEYCVNCFLYLRLTSRMNRPISDFSISSSLGVQKGFMVPGGAGGWTFSISKRVNETRRHHASHESKRCSARRTGT